MWFIFLFLFCGVAYAGDTVAVTADKIEKVGDTKYRYVENQEPKTVEVNTVQLARDIKRTEGQIKMFTERKAKLVALMAEIEKVR